MFTIKEIKEVIYHELGHVLVYLLANAQEDTSLGHIRYVILGNRTNAVVPCDNLYYCEIGNPNNHITENSKNIKRTLCWIILQFSGCLFESHYEGGNIDDCFCSKIGSSGQKDYDNLHYLKYYSSITITDEDVARLKNKFIAFLEDYAMFEKMNNYLEHFLSVFGTNAFYTFAEDEIDILLEEITDHTLNEEIILAFHRMINEEQFNFN